MLENLFFGKDDAETDIGRSGLLAASFLETAAYRNALQGKKWLVLGRKGSGKSAISLMIVRSFAGKDRCSLVTPDEISAEEIKRFDLGGIAQYQSKELLWRYVFAVQVAKYLLKYDREHPRPLQSRATSTRIRNFLVDNGEGEDLSAVERFWRIIEKLKFSLKLSALSTEVSAGIDMASGVRLSEQVDVIEKKLVEFAGEIGVQGANSFYILVDQIERIWSNDPGSDALVIGLLRAGKFVQTFYPFVNCILFLRIDIYEKLDFKERDKLRSDEFHIKWTRDDLISLVESRAAASTERPGRGKMVFREAFPRKIGETDIRHFLSGRTLNRPRDIIQFCNACRDTACAKGRKAISQWDVLTASGQYSRWKLVDLQNEWSLNYAFLADALLLISNDSYLFTRIGFERKFDALAQDFKNRYPESQRQLSADFILSILFFVGVIGAVRSTNAVYFCDCDFDEKLRIEDDELVVHPCFREALQCNSAMNLRPFDQNPQFAGELAPSTRSRFARQSIHAQEDAIDPSAYFVGDVQRQVARLREDVGDLEISPQIQDEIRTNIGQVESELNGLVRSSDALELRDSIERIAVFFRALEKGLIDSGFVSPRNDFVYSMRGIGELCREGATFGRLGRGRAFRSK
jgi:hypothetical protein